jgi:hypothetical protein
LGGSKPKGLNSSRRILVLEIIVLFRKSKFQTNIFSKPM